VAFAKAVEGGDQGRDLGDDAQGLVLVGRHRTVAGLGVEVGVHGDEGAQHAHAGEAGGELLQRLHDLVRNLRVLVQRHPELVQLGLGGEP
jgi:hypothetical protein